MTAGELVGCRVGFVVENEGRSVNHDLWIAERRMVCKLFGSSSRVHREAIPRPGWTRRVGLLSGVRRP